MIKQLSIVLFILLFLCSSVFAEGNKIDKAIYDKVSLSNKFYTNKTEALLTKTGQTITYRPVGLDDDGALELGIAHSFTVLTTGQYAGSTNVTINSKTHVTSNACALNENTGDMFLREVIQADIGPATDGKLFWEQYTLGPKIDISFVAASNTIASGSGDFDTGACCIGRKITISGAAQAGNNQVVTVVATNSYSLVVNETLVNEAAGASVSFASVDDLIWDLKDQANANSLAGYSDWRIPNLKELESIIDNGQCNPAIDGTTFPSTPSSRHWVASTNPCSTTTAWTVSFQSGSVNSATKCTDKYYIRLVR